MKKIIFYLLTTLLILGMGSCQSQESKIKENIKQHLTSISDDPENLEITSFELREDTVPIFMTPEVLSLAEELRNASEKLSIYSGIPYITDGHLYALKKETQIKERYHAAYDKAKESTPRIETIAYVETSSPDILGGKVKRSYIYILDKEEPTQISESIMVNRAFLKKYSIIKAEEGYHFEETPDGRFKLDGLSPFEKFVMHNAKKSTF